MKKRRNTLATVIAATAVLGLSAASLLLSDFSMTQNQIDTMMILIIICGCAVAYCFIVGEATQNFSQMDKLWSLLPIAYTWVVTVRGGMKPRLILYALIVTLWGIRLTMNFARKGAYRLKFWQGEEDYRWAIVRSNQVFQHRILWTLFDLFFISLYQNVLVLAICLPSVAVMESDAALGAGDLVAAALAVAFLVLETVADEYQWQFHREKKRLLGEHDSSARLPAPYACGFNTTGPWGRMRHPNYLGEQGIWLSLYLFTVGAGVTRCGVFHWTLIGPLFLVLLFMGSSSLGEKISSQKYPDYAAYSDRVFKYLPLHSYKG